MSSMRLVLIPVLSLFAAVLLFAQQDNRPVGVILTRTLEQSNTSLLQPKQGMNFSVLAREHSIDPSAQDGGYLGLTGAEHLDAHLRDAAERLQPGEYSNAISLPSGFAVVTIFKRAPETHDLDSQKIASIPSDKPVRQSINVAGMSEEDSVFEEYSKRDGWNLDLHEPCTIRKESHQAAVTKMQTLLAAAEGGPGLENGPKPEPIEIMRSHVALAQLFAFVGDLDSSIREWSSAYQIAQASVPGAIPYMQEALGVSYLHRAGIENGVMRDSGTIDIFPPVDPTAHYNNTEDSQKAVQYFLSFLDQAPADLQVRWLLNLAYLTLGKYPAGVPTRYLISPVVFQSRQNIGRFTDVARETGLNVFAAAGGVIVDDFDNDGFLDVITSSVDLCDSMHYFHNNGNGTFSDRTLEAGLSNQLGALNMIQADYNNDGCMDILMLRGGWEFPIRKSLLAKNCNGTFTDVTRDAGLASGKLAPTQTAVWADIDNDGFLALFVGNENAPSQLFHNKGNGTFEDISHAAGIDKVAFTKAVVSADYDKDGYPDFYVSNYGGAHFLYHNNGNLTFTDVARQAGVQAPFLSFSIWFFDFDNDGWPDLFVTSYHSFTVDQVMRSYLKLPISAETLKLYRNRHDGTFADVTIEFGLDKVFMPMGANFGDVDNDGFLDVYLGMGQPSFADLMPHVLLRNDAGKSFVDITASSGTGELHKGHGIAFADLDRDGDEDIVAEIGGAVPADRHALRLFENPGNRNDWLTIRLVGVKTNRAAIGARIKVTVETTGDDNARVTLFIYRTVGSGGSFGANPLEQHIGLGFSARIQNVEIWWPASNTRQSFATIAANQFIEITELAADFTKLDRKPYRLGGGKRER